MKQNPVTVNRRGRRVLVKSVGELKVGDELSQAGLSALFSDNRLGNWVKHTRWSLKP